MPADLNAVLPQITAERAKALMVELVRVPSPLTALFEAEPQLRAFIDKAVEPRLREMGITDIRRDAMGNLCATLGAQRQRALADAGHQCDDPAARDHAQSLRRRGARRRAIRVAGRGGAGQGPERAEGAARRDPAGAAIHPRRENPDRRTGRVPVLRLGRDRPPRRDPQHRRGDRRARRDGDPQRHRQPHQPRQPRPRRRHRHGARQPGPFEPAAKRLQRRHRRAGGGPPAHRRLESRRAASGARQGDACGQQDPQRAGFDPHHSGHAARSASTAA